MLEFGDKTQTVCMDAIRLVQRMDRDWIRTGRRPSGICGAALLISARLHNFRRTQREIMQVVKIADATLRRRLEEFRMTPSGNLSVADFRSLWLEQAVDPPAFTNNRKKARKAHEQQQRDAPQSALQRVAQTGSHLPPEEECSLARPDLVDNGEISVAEFDNQVDRAFAEEFATYLGAESLKFVTSDMARDDFNPDVSTWSDLDDDEVNNIMLGEEEVRQKTEIWDRENKEFVEERERKRKAKEEEEGTRRRRKSTRKKSAVPGATPLESAQNMLATRRLSKKINYEVLGKLLNKEETGPKVHPAHAGMIPSGAPSRMISVAGTPMARSGYATPTQETLIGGTQLSTIDELPAALASVATDNGAATETIVYEEEHNEIQSTAVDMAAAADDEDYEDDSSDGGDDHYASMQAAEEEVSEEEWLDRR
ncbi:transcription factor TFIIIB subunit brf1 [Coemansia sp. RSA 2706]|nr:transcription factor TFIIIB subunit brf1 [Coemansia sp. RSA 2706]KAJ2328463.1 transcription factor TFIIIB subunit brf1 [Coemansia sp. RSA 2702]